MREGPLIFTSLWGKRAVLLVSWALSVLALIIFAAHNDLNKLYRNTQSWEPESRLPTNQMRAFSYRRYNSKENGRPVYSISFKHLLVENNNFGIFKTAAHKVVKIRDLELTFHRYAPLEITSSPNLISNIYTGELLDDVYNLINHKDGWRINIDISNTSEVCVTNFDYKVFSDGAPLLIVRSKRATASNKLPDVVTLRGHVIVKAVDGSVFESNCVTWDTRKHHFTADGTYFLSRDGKKIRGKDICVDDKLNIVQAQTAALKERSKENG